MINNSESYYSVVLQFYRHFHSPPRDLYACLTVPVTPTQHSYHAHGLDSGCEDVISGNWGVG